MLYCQTQCFTDQKLSSTIFPCCSFVRCPASVASPLRDAVDKKNWKKWEFFPLGRRPPTVFSLAVIIRPQSQNKEMGMPPPIWEKFQLFPFYL